MLRQLPGPSASSRTLMQPEAPLAAGISNDTATPG
jgi:hypothetical protein